MSMAEQLADSTHMALSHKNNISVITPEYNGLGQIMFRDNQQRMIKDQQVLCKRFTKTLKVYYRGIRIRNLALEF